MLNTSKRVQDGCSAFGPLRLSSAVLALGFLAGGGCAPGQGGGDSPAGPGPFSQSAPPIVTSISGVQGVGPQSPRIGQTVQVEGIVTAWFPRLRGGFIESAAADVDAEQATSEGLFLAWDSVNGGASPALGHRIRVVGVVHERGEGGGGALPSLTALQVLRVVDLGPAPDALPPPVVLSGPPEDLAFWDAVEGMRVRIEAPLVVAGNGSLARFGELVLAISGRLFQPTELAPPGPEAEAIALENARRRLVLDDGDPNVATRPPDYLPLSAPSDATPLRGGTGVLPFTAIVDVRRGGVLLLPIERISVVTGTGARPPPPWVPGDLRVAVLNVENLFNGDGAGGGFPTSRGASTPAAYAMQQAKLVATLQALDVEVAALSEIENDGAGPRTALAQFVDALNAAGPARDWRAIEVAEGPGTDQIRVAIIYRSDRVDPVGEPVLLNHPAFAWGSRPPVGQAFQRRINGSMQPGGSEPAPQRAPWLIVANHLKSKGGCPAPGAPNARPGDEDRGDHQACWNATRVQAAEALAEWLASDPAGVGVERVLLVGDLNSYAREDPIRRLEARGWVDAFAVAQGSARGGVGDARDASPYSYVFQGLSGRLDHVLVPVSGARFVVGTAIWHTNADEWTGFGYASGADAGVWRSSDHDVLVVGVSGG